MVVESSESAQRSVSSRPRPSWLWTFATWSLVVFSLCLSAFLCVVVGGVAALLGDRHRRVAHQMLRFGYLRIVEWHPRYRLRLTGLEHLPRGPAVLCPNHQSHADVVYLFALPKAFKWIVKKELFRVPLFGSSMRVARYPMVDRGDPDSALLVMKQVRELLASGISVLSFPEGTRSVDGSVGRFQSGAARMAVSAQVPLVPIGVAGTDTLLPRGSAMFSNQRRLAIHVGPPISTEGADLRQVRQLTHKLRDAVVAAKSVAVLELDDGRSRRAD
jgi:1-acyl-sn-glycerol-3-phosphate acyltransferase